tara:strand:+ start:3001 stop:4035 length:1035 start_codon:yes stop_codon:yes gene_type:complete
MTNNTKVLVTGAAGFIGYHLSKKLLKKKYFVIGIDNLNNYYDKNLKLARLHEIEKSIRSNQGKWEFHNEDIINIKFLSKLFEKHKPQIVINLAAQAGVRYSLKNPKSYIDSNICGFSNVIECSKEFNVKNFIFASSSSVYGGNESYPFSETQSVNHPVSLYAATKKSNELIAHSYSHLYNLPTTGLRFFTVYGPWGRPDMAPMIFTEAIFQEKEIKVFNKGNMSRDFTYIDDVINPIILLIKKPALPNSEFKKDNPNPSNSWAPYRIFNIGGNKTIKLMNFIYELENLIGKKTKKNLIEMQPGDILNTSADTSLLSNWVDYEPKTSLNEGLKKFINWYKKYYRY